MLIALRFLPRETSPSPTVRMAGSTSAHALSLPGHYVPPLPPVSKLPSCYLVLRAGAGALQGPFSKLRWNLQEDPTVRGLRTHFWEVRTAQVHTEDVGGSCWGSIWVHPGPLRSSSTLGRFPPASGPSWGPKSNFSCSACSQQLSRKSCSCLDAASLALSP